MNTPEKQQAARSQVRRRKSGKQISTPKPPIPKNAQEYMRMRAGRIERDILGDCDS